LIARLVQAVESGSTVLVPNTELAAALADAVERFYLIAGRQIWPTPRIRDFAGWLKDQYIRRQLTDSSLPRCLGDVEERELWRDAVLGTDANRFLEPSGAARAARRARRATHEYGIPMSAIAADGGEEATLFVEWSARFAQRCRDLECIGADDLLGGAAGRGDTRAASDAESAAAVAWIESPLWRPVARAWLERHAGAPLAPHRLEGRAQGRRVPQVICTQSPEAELATIAEWARGHLARRGDFRAWICVPDLAQRRAELVDAFDAALAADRFTLLVAGSGAPYAIAGGTPLADFAPVRSALELLSAASGRIPFAQFSALLRAPELSESLSEASAAACLDVALRSSASAEASLSEWLTLAQKVERVEELRPAPALLRITSALQTLTELKGSHAMSRWLSVWIACFELGPWRFRHRWSTGEYQSAERFRELLGALAQGDGSFGSQTRTSAESILRRAARDTQFQVQTGIPPIWVSGQWMDPWLAYDGFWVASCDQSHWPPPVEPLPLLPVRLQRQYGVIGASMEAQLRFAEDLQGRWLERASHCAFSCADTEDGRRAAPSPLLDTFFSPAAGAPGTGGAGTGGAGTGGAGTDTVIAGVAPALSQPHWRAQFERAPIFERLEDEWAPAFGADERTRGVATLKAQSRCAFRGFAETRLRVDALELPVPGFNERERGELVHDSLQQIWSQLGGSAGLAKFLARPQELAGLIEESARRAIAILSARRNPGDRWREREQERLLKLIWRWLELEAERGPFEIERLEAGSEIARHAGLAFSVRIDRIDRLPDGSRLLIDYKTGAAYRDWQGERPDNPQLPIYALLHSQALVAVAYGKINATECAFIAEAERGGVFPKKRPSRLEGLESLSELMGRWAQRIERLAREFREGRALVDPLPTACRSCHLHGLCRVPSTLDLSESLDQPAEDA
jgi:hypothetical protein